MNSMLVLNRDHTLITTKGHAIEFKKDVPTHVPPAVYADAIAIGAQPPDGTAPAIPEAPKAEGHGPADPADRAPIILAAIEKLVGINDRKDFTAAGSPTVKAVEREVKFDVDAREIAAQWQVYHDNKAAK